MKAKIKHVGLHPNRLKPEAGNPREVAFAKQWVQENDDGAGCNTLAWLLVKAKGNVCCVLEKTEQLVPYNQQSASVAATVIQWLGSNVGFYFLREALADCGYEIVKKSEGRKPGRVR